jgi:diguanylate cyclase (GGDEF)-like protein
MDLDRLKAVNDLHGHLEGDAVLRRFAQLCADITDLGVARLGGDEFVIIASDFDQRAAGKLAYVIHEAVRADPELSRRDVTISIGLGSSPTVPRSKTARRQIRMCDKKCRATSTS